MTERKVAYWETEFRDMHGTTTWWGGMPGDWYGEYEARMAAQRDLDATGRYRPVYAEPGEPRDVKEERNGD